MKNFRTALLFILVLMLIVSTSACKPTASIDDSPIKLSLAHFFPSTHPAETELIAGWAAEMKVATDGKLIIESYPGETLLNAADIYGGVVSGVADIGMSCFSYTRGRFPVLEAFELPGIVYKNSKVASKVAWEGIKALNPDEVKDTKLLMVIATGPGDLFTKVPVRSLSDIQGLEIRATGLSADTITQLGGKPVGMAQSEAYESLQKGIVKGNLSPVEVLKGWRHAEVTNYLTRTPFLYNTLFFITMNLDKWNSLSKEMQDIVLEVTQKHYENVGIGLWDMQNDAAMDYAINERKMEEIVLSDEEATKWIDKVMPIQEKFKKSMLDAGITKDILKTVNDLADQYNAAY